MTEEFDMQIGSLWGLAHCPRSDHNLTNTSTNTTDNDGQARQGDTYDSSTIVLSTHVGLTLLAGVLLLFCYSGVHKVSVRGSLDTLRSILPCYRDMESGATSNTRFVVYYFASSLGALLTVVALLLDQGQVEKAFRIVIQVCQRIFFGAASVLLTIALNHQREHRHHDALHGDIGIVQLVGQIRRINYAVVVIFIVYVLAELGTSFATQTNDLRIAMATVSFVVAIVLNAPIIAAAFWICFHKGHVAPALEARIAIITGVFLRFFGYLDPSFWNKLVLKDWTTQHPCALGGELSFYDLMSIIGLVGQILIALFVISEFRRSRSIVTQESSLIATAQYDEWDDDKSSNPSEGDLQRAGYGSDHLEGGGIGSGGLNATPNHSMQKL